MAIAHAARGGSQGGAHNAASIVVTVTAQIGDTIIVYYAASAGSPNVTSVVDNASPANTYSLAVIQSTNVHNEIWYSLNVTHAPTTVTLNFNTTVESAAAVETYTGVKAVGSNGNNSGSSTSPSVTITTQGANNWVVMCAGNTTATVTYSASAPNQFWHSASSASTGGIIEGGSFDGGNVVTPGSVTVTGTFSSSEPWGTVGLELWSTVPPPFSSNFSYMCGFEMGLIAGGASGLSAGEPYVIEVLAAPKLATNIVHGGKYSMRCNTVPGNQSYVVFEQRQIGPTGGVVQMPIFCSVRFYMYIASLPSAQTVIYTGQRLNISVYQTILLNTDGSIDIQDGAGVTAHSSPRKLTTGVWHQISLGVNPNDGSNHISLTVDGVLWAQVTSTPTNTIVYDAAWIGVGIANTTCNSDIYFDDIIWDNGLNGEVVIGPGFQVLLKPVSDSAIGNWTGGAGGVTNLWQAVDNEPPLGTTAALETNTTQIKNGSATVPSDYTAKCQTYAAAGVPSGSKINAVAAIDSDSTESIAAPTLGALWIASNPAQGVPLVFNNFAYNDDTGIAIGTFPQGWTTREGPVTTSPTVTLTVAPTVSIRKITSSALVDDVDFMGIYVDYLPPSGVADGFKVFWMG